MSPTHHVVFVFSLIVIALSRPITAWNCKGCKDVFDNFSQCAAFIQGQGTDPTPGCCQSVANLNVVAKEERGGSVRICKCIEYFAFYKAPKPFVAARIQELPVKCNTRLSFPISERINCFRIV